MNNAYWLIQLIDNNPTMRGPYASDKERENELAMCLLDPGTQHVILIDPGALPHGNPHAWTPSYQYKKDLLDAIDNLPD